LVDKGMTREDAYRKVQQHALAAWEGGPDLKSRVAGDPEIIKFLNSKEIEALFDLKRHTKHVDIIFNRAMNS
jgi:adenylosuccinate lyase